MDDEAKMITEPADLITYETRAQLIAELERRGYSPEWIREKIEHEDAHMKKALELGYKPRYCLGVTEDLEGIRCRPGVHLDESASDEDLIQMLSAPKRLSSYDKNHLRLLRDKQTADIHLSN